MEISVDISLYPLKEEFVEPILAFIKAVEENPDVNVERNSLSTQVFGEYKTVMAMLEKEIFTVFEELPHSIFVIKLVGNNRQGILK